MNMLDKLNIIEERIEGLKQDLKNKNIIIEEQAKYIKILEGSLYDKGASYE